jgi:hypothetical protein
MNKLFQTSRIKLDEMLSDVSDFIKIQKMLDFFVYESYGFKWDYFIDK